MPTISVVIAARSGAGPALSCLASLSGLPRQPDEILIANACGAEAEAQFRQRDRRVRVVPVPPEWSIAQQRGAAIQKASGDIVAVLHERYHVTPEWMAAVLSTHRAGPAVVGGCVAPSSGLSLAAWAIYLSEYSHVMPPLPEGVLDFENATMLPGGNVAYTAPVFQRASMMDSLWELDFHEKLFHAGVPFSRHTAMTAQFHHAFTVREYLAERLQVSFRFAGQAAAGKSLAQCLAAAALRCALPLLVLFRIGSRVFRKGQYQGRFLAALPWILFFGLVQMAGEMSGFLFAPRHLPAEAAPAVRAQNAGTD